MKVEELESYHVLKRCNEDMKSLKPFIESLERRK